jgi:uncharacterized protein (DUF2384 family)
MLIVENYAMSAATAFQIAEPKLFNPKTGRLDAERIAHELNVPVSLIAESIGRKAPGVRKHPDSVSLQHALRRIYSLWVRLVELFAGDKIHARIFLNAPNRHLENRAPLEFIQSGDMVPLESMIEAMNFRQPV